MRIRTAVRICLLLALLLGVLVPAADAASRRRRRGGSETRAEDYKAYELLNRGKELLELDQEERAEKMLLSIPQMFPDSKIRFDAHAVLGRHFLDKRKLELAIKQFRLLEDSEDAEHRAEALYRTGICYYHLNNFDKAFMALRKVTNLYPWSVYANQAYYYIGQCHFRLGRWSKAVKALELVGTSVPMEGERRTLAEAGQRFFVKIHDKDLVVLQTLGQTLEVELATQSGDVETVTLSQLGQDGEHYLGSIPVAPGKAAKDDGALQIVGPDAVEMRYVDANTADGVRNTKVINTVHFVSTASIGFTDGAYREYARGVFGDAESYMRVKDLDRDLTDNPDTIEARVVVRYKVEEEEDLSRRGIDLDLPEEEWRERDVVAVTLTETGPHTGIFVGGITPRVIQSEDEALQGDEMLACMPGDRATLEYLDELHLGGDEARLVEYDAKVLVGRIPEPAVQDYIVNDPNVRARKNLIEARIFLKLAGIFKEVGLVDQAREKADRGLERVEEVIRANLEASLEREVVEGAFSAKWDLLIVQGRLQEAIRVCYTLIRLFPESTLVDKALYKIGQARLDAGDDDGAIRIFAEVLRLPQSELKAEAQYRIAEALEAKAIRDARHRSRTPDLSRAMLAYKKCADLYPDSPFAAESLDAIATYYIETKDFARAVRLMEQVFQDYPDAGFLDRMLYKWIIASYRMGDFTTALEKCELFLAQHTGSSLAPKVRRFKPIIAKKAGVSGGSEEGAGDDAAGDDDGGDGADSEQ